MNQIYWIIGILGVMVLYGLFLRKLSNTHPNWVQVIIDEYKKEKKE